jgi:hypothetical protein
VLPLLVVPSPLCLMSAAISTLHTHHIQDKIETNMHANRNVSVASKTGLRRGARGSRSSSSSSITCCAALSLARDPGISEVHAALHSRSLLLQCIQRCLQPPRQIELVSEALDLVDFVKASRLAPPQTLRHPLPPMQLSIKLKAPLLTTGQDM